MIKFLITVVMLLSCMGLPTQAKGVAASSCARPVPPAPKPQRVVHPAPVAAVAKPVPVRVVASAPQKSAPTFSSKGNLRTVPATSRAGWIDTAEGRLARLTAYWASEGDYYTRHGVSSTGIHLHGGHCAVDPSIIPYGSVVEIAGLGKYLAVDTGSAVISREAARGAAHSAEERSALVIDLYFDSRADGQSFAASGPKYASISWWTPSSTGSEAKEARSSFADENWSKIQSKQL